MLSCINARIRETHEALSAQSHLRASLLVLPSFENKFIQTINVCTHSRWKTSPNQMANAQKQFTYSLACYRSKVMATGSQQRASFDRSIELQSTVGTTRTHANAARNYTFDQTLLSVLLQHLSNDVTELTALLRRRFTVNGGKSYSEYPRCLLHVRDQTRHTKQEVTSGNETSSMTAS